MENLYLKNANVKFYTAENGKAYVGTNLYLRNVIG